ncbi:hypothetical protein L6164_030531 [Bauhinia variegata]|uniref:Uncharacterized protein n=1 Tax=Bauhinia variegata TaxID=167791 RepID=A0ACB9LC00_BAUVA|nr:hypothetical protein L6164_030531 [Bauhinia variegata]
MGNEHHHHFYHQNLHTYQRNTFLPMLCSRPSIKDVSVPRCRDHSIAFSKEPLSPRIGCMGQVKRNNKIAGFPTSHRLSFTGKLSSATSIASPVVKYSKLKKLFSGKNLGSSTTATPPATVFSCGSRQQVTVNGADVSRNGRCKNESCAFVNIDNMDPPLPVIKRVHRSEEGSQVDSLWKRRSGGVALKSLQIQQIQNTKHRLQPTSV